jgi:predicted O-linked N-acetylglucosamine transferase (SPINDLY family)
LVESPGLSQKEFRENIIKRFENHGVDKSRLDLRERDSTKQYLIYNEIDVCLDPFPCNGGTTSLDLLWMGVPLVALAGDSFVSRMGVTWLSNLQRTEWIANSKDEYVEIAIRLTKNISELDKIRRDQRGRIENSPMMNEALFAEQFSNLMWNTVSTDS